MMAYCCFSDFYHFVHIFTHILKPATENSFIDVISLFGDRNVISQLLVVFILTSAGE